MVQLTDLAQETFWHAAAICASFGCAEVSVEHLLLAVLDTRGELVGPLLDQLGVDVRLLRRQIEESLEPARGAPEGTAFPMLSEPFRRAIGYAEEEAEGRAAGVYHLLIGAIHASPPGLREALERHGLSERRLREHMFRWAQAQPVIPCDRCGAPASVHITEVTAGRTCPSVRHRHYCATCAPPR